MQHESKDQRKEFLLEQMSNASGQPVKPESTLDQATQQAMSDKVWNAFVAQFTGKS